MKNSISYSKLSSGLRIVHCQRKATVEYFGVAINAGSRDETEPELYGLAHFVEHTIFKGTGRRKAWHILNRMEAVGGELNAYTTKEETFIYTTAPRGNLRRAVELISDLVTGSVFPQAELNKEREVVADEINSYLDVPSEGIFDDFEDLIYSGNSLGHNILGSVKSLAGFSSEDCRRYLERFYTPGEMVVFYSGPQTPSAVYGVVEQYFGQLVTADARRNRITPCVNPPFDEVRQLNLHQAHTVMGAVTGGMKSDSRYAMALLTNILGGPGMNSLLNIELRERRGLVYSIDASTSLLSDTGLFTLYFGCDAGDLNRCRRLVSDVISRIADGLITPHRLSRAKKQYAGQLMVATTNAEQSALSMARGALYYGEADTVDQTISRIYDVTGDEIKDAAETLTRMSVLTMM